MGFLVTYNWRTEGQYFPVRLGKNYIGAGHVSSEVDHPKCQILIETDQMLSAEHALILCRGGVHGTFELIDQKSSNGTFLNDKPVPISGTALPNYGLIRTGSTDWIFVMVEPEGASGTTSSSSS
ncbi:MAG: FHA domain-containing protein [Gammaproteobacteria bacterium]